MTVPATRDLPRPVTRFTMPGDLAATEPPEARGLARDGVRLLAAIGSSPTPTPTPATERDGDPATGRGDRDAGVRIEHARFSDLGRFLLPGDLLVVNTSATRAAAVDAALPDGRPAVAHFSTLRDDGSWVVEVRTAPSAQRPVRTLRPGTRLELPEGRRLVLLDPEPADQGPAGPRLWRTQPLDPGTVQGLLARHGRPIRYGYVGGDWPVSAYQTVFAIPDGPDGAAASAEMPSAGRPFSSRLVAELAVAGVLFAPVTLHAGVSSQESGEPPAPERYRVPARTADLLNHTRAAGGRVIAVGTTVTRALESAAGTRGVRAADGWTGLVLSPQRPVRVVDGLITGLHDPDASHLLLLEAVAGSRLVQQVYDAAVEGRYRWHEFGDACLLVRGPGSPVDR